MPDLYEEMFKAGVALDAGSREPFENDLNAAKYWHLAERSGDSKLIEGIDFSVPPLCWRCGKQCKDPVSQRHKTRGCSKCQGVIYCSRECQVEHWNNPAVPGASNHKQVCPSLKEHMKQVPYFQSEAKQFPWGRVEKDGTFAHNVIKARAGLLGADATTFGYWAVPGTNRNDSFGSRGHPRFDQIKHKLTKGKADYFKDERHVPHLFFTDDFPPPKKVQPGQVKDWKSWYEWRGLPLDSHAAMLMDSPLSVYHLLTDVLCVVNPSASAENRQRLEVHYLGPEFELNFLPLFSELALLLPYVDLTLVMFGKAVADLVRAARAKSVDTLASQVIVWSYTAPKRSGGGSIAIKLHSKTDDWEKLVLADSTPNALVALNSGLVSYDAWVDPIGKGMPRRDIPFGITEYSALSMELFAGAIPIILRDTAAEMAAFPGLVPALLRDREHAFAPNPFHRPGQRGVGQLRTPNLFNGFAMSVVKKEA